MGGSCTSSIVEEEPLKLLNKEIEIVEGTVRVESFDRYENLITGREKIGVLPFLSFQENFQEMMKSGKNLRISQEGYYEINSWDGSTLLGILDQNGFVILEKYLIYLNFNNRTAVVSTNLELKEKILEGDVSSDDIKLFSFDDDVIGLLETNSPSTIPKSGYNLRIASVFDPLAATATIGCGWDKCDNSQYFNDPFNGDVIGLGNNGGTFKYRLDAKHVYQAAAISFKLFSKVNHMRKPEDGSLLWTATSTSLYIFWDYEYLSKKSGSTLQKAIFQGNTVNNELVATYYSSGRGLEKFYLRSQFYAIPGGNHGYSPAGAYWQFNLQQIDKGY
jgi:hypothetical protein